MEGEKFIVMAKLVQQYYTPELKRFHPGFEFEAFSHWREVKEGEWLPLPNEVKWIKTSIPTYGTLDISALNYLIHNKMVRLPIIEYK